MNIPCPLLFTKMSGAGNDFIIIDNRDLRIAAADQPALATALCRRGVSVGADGLILIEPSTTVDFRWQFYNSDGSVAEMCGNGARCAARFAHKLGIANASMKFETVAGIIGAKLLEGGQQVRVEMTDPFGYDELPPITLGGEHHSMSFINTGVPHVVIFIETDHHTAETWGREIRFHSLFEPAGTNVNFVSREADGVLLVKTYERGVEEITRACGTGVVAAGIVASLKDAADLPVRIRTSGGEELVVSFLKHGDLVDEVTLQGPARIVYEAALTPEALL